MMKADLPVIDTAHDLFSYLDEYLYVNKATPRVAGIDFVGNPFIAWLNNPGSIRAAIAVVTSTVDSNYNFDTWRSNEVNLNYPLTLLEV